jgi:F420-non-reducing hydrogenase iron-sulfur subunit
MAAFEPKILALLCNWCAYDGADSAGRARLDIPPNIREIRLMCSGQADVGLILKAFASGADGVMVLGCQPGDCHYKTGNHHALKRIALLRAVLKQSGVAESRVMLAWVSAGQGERYATLVRQMVETIRALGPFGKAKSKERAHG